MASMTEDEEMLLAIIDSDDDSDVEELIFLSVLERKEGIGGSATGKTWYTAKF